MASPGHAATPDASPYASPYGGEHRGFDESAPPGRSPAAGPRWGPHWRDGRLVDPRVSEGDRTLAVLMHVWWVFSFVIGPWAALFPLGVWMVRQSTSGFIDDHGREIINAQITLLILAIIPPLWPVAVVWIIVNAIASIRAAAGASRREHFRYPMTFRPLG